MLANVQRLKVGTAEWFNWVEGSAGQLELRLGAISMDGGC